MAPLLDNLWGSGVGGEQGRPLAAFLTRPEEPCRGEGEGVKGNKGEKGDGAVEGKWMGRDCERETDEREATA